jgi:hypothetical protein
MCSASIQRRGASIQRRFLMKLQGARGSASRRFSGFSVASRRFVGAARRFDGALRQFGGAARRFDGALRRFSSAAVRWRVASRRSD